MKKFTIIKVTVVLVFVGGMISCKKSFDRNPETELDASQVYRNVFDADAAILGLYGKFSNIADRYLILNELRADLMHTTVNSDQYLQEISTHNVSANNPYANPRPFYELILNCNDILKNFVIMRQKNALKEAEFNQRYSDVVTLRSFLYLQLGIHYGDEVRYITSPLERITDINDESKFPKITFNNLLDSLIQLTEAIPHKDIYPTGTSLNITLDAYGTSRFFINKKTFLGDLYLWKGNYRRAATYYREVMETFTEAGNLDDWYAGFKLGTGGGSNHNVSYSVPGNISNLLINDGWRLKYEPSDRGFSREWIWTIPFDNRFTEINPLVNLFSPIGGKYLVKPAKEIMDKWSMQRQYSPRPSTTLGLGAEGIPLDARGVLSVQNVAGQPTIMKFLYPYIDENTNTAITPLVKNNRWFIYGQTHMHLRFAEAANREGFHRLAHALVNSGINNAFSLPSPEPVDKTNSENTLSYPDPYKFDARNGEIPRYRSAWHRNTGIRGRANVTDVPVTIADSLTAVENQVIEEGALENAFEGTRWDDLLRVAIRRNDPAFIADKVFQRLSKEGSAGAAEARAKLMRREWYLPFNLK